MKLSVIAVAALSAVSTNAIAIAVAEANPSPEAWCFWKGQGCWKAKRAADAFSQALQSTGGYKESRAADISNHPGGAAYHAKRSFEELAALVASAYPNPEALYADLNLSSHFGPDSNLTEADGSEGEPAAPPEGAEGGAPLAARDEEEAAVDPRGFCFWKGRNGCWKREATPWCFWKGQGCWKRGVEMSKREAEANPWCFWKGQGCWKRTDENTSAVQRRDAAPAFCPFGGEAGSVCYASKRDFVEADRRACEEPGEACHKARSAAEALLRSIEESTDEEPAKREDMGEVAARCNGPSGACTAARRDLTSMHAAARNLLDTLDAEVV